MFSFVCQLANYCNVLEPPFQQHMQLIIINIVAVQENSILKVMYLCSHSHKFLDCNRRTYVGVLKLMSMDMISIITRKLN